MSEHSDSTTSRPTTPLGPLPDNLHSAARPAFRFTWDPASRQPGPESVSGTTEGRGGDNFAAPPRLGFLNTSSVSLVFGALPTEWSSSRHGFHAISTVLNNPHKRQAPPKAHSSLPGVPPAELPRVRRKDFDSYIKAIAPEWERYERNAQLGREGTAQLDNGPSTPRPSLSTFPSSASSQRTQINTSNRGIPPLETVPPIFFDPDFNLSDPKTFAVVAEQPSDPLSSDDPSDPSALAHSLPLLEKFSHYADTVEQHLIREIAIRSTSFFAALTNLNDLQTESEECLARIASLRTSLKEVDEKVAKKGLEVVRTQCKVRNVEKVKEGVKLVNEVVEMSGVAKGLVTSGQWEQALDVIDHMERMWRDEAPSVTPSVKLTPKPRRQNSANAGRSSSLPATQEEDVTSNSTKPDAPHIPLSSLKAFAALPTHLRTLTMEVTSSLSFELVSALREDLILRMTCDDDNIKRPKREHTLQDRIRPLLRGLVRTRGVKEATLSWREVALGEIRQTITQRFHTLNANGDAAEAGHVVDPETRSGWANQMRKLGQAEFLSNLQAVYRALLNGVEGLRAQSKIVLDVLQSIDSPNLPHTTTIEDELADTLSSAVELAHTQAAKVITLRAEQHSVLELPDFLAFFNESWNFVVKCEVICRKMIVGLRGVVVSQAKSFLQTFHQARISRSAKLVEDEQWNPTEVSPALQRFTNVLIDSAVRDSPELIVNTELSSPPLPSSFSPNGQASTNGATVPPPAMISSPSAPAPPKTNGTGAGSKHLRIEERTYFAVSATAEVLILLLDYLRVIVNLSMLTSDTMSRVIEFLKAFNSRTCQVVLGAGAMRSAGLKNITAKHLALASQSLSIMFELIPYVRETFRRHLSPKQAVMLVEFDKLKRDYQEHQNEIHAKLIAIMGDRLSAHIITLQGVDWNVPKPGGGVNDYMEVLVKETVTLHKVLSRYLSIPIVEYVMTQVFAAINHRLSEEYGKIELPHQEAKDRLLADARFLHQKLAALKNVGTPSGMLETVISEKGIPRKNAPPPPQVAAPTRSNTFYNVSSSANQRLKGLLASKSATVDKALPPPRSSSSTPPLPPIPRSSSPKPISQNGSTNGIYASRSSSSSLNPGQEGVTPSGFKQVEIRSPIIASEKQGYRDESNLVIGSGDSRQLQQLDVASSPPPLSPRTSLSIPSSNGGRELDSHEPGRSSSASSTPLMSPKASTPLSTEVLNPDGHEAEADPHVQAVT